MILLETGMGGWAVTFWTVVIIVLSAFFVAVEFSLMASKPHRLEERADTRAGRADKKGVVRFVSQKYRTQKANRLAATERLRQLIAEALKKPRIRKKTHIPRSAHERRLKEKKQRGALKRLRSEKNFEL